MLGHAWFLARKDLGIMLRQRETILWTFIMPIVFFFFIGSVTGGFGGSPPGTLTTLLVDRPPEAGFLADHLGERLTGQSFRVVLADTVADPSVYSRRLTIPTAFTDSVLAGHPTKVRFQNRAEGMGGSYDQLRLQRAIFAVIGDLVVASEATPAGGPPTAALLTEAAAVPPTVTLSAAPARRSRDIPVGFSQAVPGTMVMFTLLVMLTTGGVSLVIERDQGLLRRLASAPMPRGSVVLGKWFGRVGLGIIQIGFAMLVGRLFFRMDWGPDVPMLLLVLAVYAGLCGVIGILLGNLARTQGQAVAIGVLAANVFGALGGCWWPIEIVPSWMQRLALFLPTGQAMDALHNLVSFQTGPVGALQPLIILSTAALAVGWLATRTFRFQ